MNVALDLLRHGETRGRGFRGQLDDALTPAGWQAMRAAVAGHAWEAIVTSPLRRCAAFAAELATTRGLPLRVEPHLMEYAFGAWQGVPLATLAAAHGDALARFWADPVAAPPPGAETLAAFEARVIDALDAIAGEWPRQRVLVVTHGGVIRLLRCLVSGAGYARMSGIDAPHASLWPLPWRARMRNAVGT